jgi:hypothetical protein
LIFEESLIEQHDCSSNNIPHPEHENPQGTSADLESLHMWWLNNLLSFY